MYLLNKCLFICSWNIAKVRTSKPSANWKPCSKPPQPDRKWISSGAELEDHHANTPNVWGKGVVLAFVSAERTTATGTTSNRRFKNTPRRVPWCNKNNAGTRHLFGFFPILGEKCRVHVRRKAMKPRLTAQDMGFRPYEISCVSSLWQVWLTFLNVYKKIQKYYQWPCQILHISISPETNAIQWPSWRAKFPSFLVTSRRVATYKWRRFY